MKEAKRTQITEQICKQIRLMRKGGANQTEIGALIGINPSTVSRIEKAGFDVEKYLENKRIAREKEKAVKGTVTVELFSGPDKIGEIEEQVPGQMEMDLTPKSETSDQVKMMRFVAGQVDKLYMKLETVNDTLSQILRAMRGD